MNRVATRTATVVKNDQNTILPRVTVKEMSDQDRGWHASCFQKFFRSLFIEEIKAERPYGHRNQEREKLTGAKRNPPYRA